MGRTDLTSISRLGRTACLGLLIAAAPRPASPASTRPALTDRRTVASISADLDRVRAALEEVLPSRAFSESGVVTDPVRRAAAGPRILPLLKEKHVLAAELTAARHDRVVDDGGEYESLLYLFGDQATVDRVDADAVSQAASVCVPARAIRIRAAWAAAGGDSAARRAVAADLEKLDAAHPDSEQLTTLTFGLAASPVPLDLKLHLLDVSTKTMKNSMATRLAGPAVEQRGFFEAEAHTADLEGKPLVIAGPAADGKPFTSADYRGRVVLVDFWATWCGPCKAELPRVKALYAQYHARGLEVVGVANDYSAHAAEHVAAYAAKTDLPWVQLVDPVAAAANKWNPITWDFGIRGIPQMFLIDRRGVCRTVEARDQLETLIPALLAD